MLKLLLQQGYSILITVIPNLCIRNACTETCAPKWHQIADWARLVSSCFPHYHTHSFSSRTSVGHHLALDLFAQAIADESFHSMITRAEASQLHLFAIDDFLGVGIAPFDRHIAVGICVHENIESAVALQLR